ncbi:MAG TPA: S16 family serine protease [Actinomycetota bacterium]|nr:S16 family serine protease [Actinomycetota bacterium]
MLLIGAPAAALVISLFAVELPVFVEAPGRTREVLPLIDVDGAPTYGSRGRLLLTTVSLGPANAFEAVAGWLDPNTAVLSEDEILAPGQTQEEYDEASRSQMDESKIAAVAVALEALTDYPREHGPGVIVQDILAGSPADGALHPGDLIVSIDGRSIDAVEDLRARIVDAGTRSDLELGVRPLEGGEVRTVTLRPVRIPGENRPVIGIASVPNFPFEVTISSGDIGGPSAGLMWAIGVTDVLTPGDLTDGQSVAGTGTVSLDGRVGPIGGVRLKVVAAEEAGADVFLVPASNLPEARGAGDRIRLVPVATVEDAVEALGGEA